MSAMDLIIVDEPHLSDLEIQRKSHAIAPDWCYLGYKSFQQIKECPTLPAPVLLLQPRPEINDLLTRHNQLVFVVMDGTNSIWQMQNYKGQASLISPYNSEILGGHFIHTIPELVSILLEGW